MQRVSTSVMSHFELAKTETASVPPFMKYLYIQWYNKDQIPVATNYSKWEYFELLTNLVELSTATGVPSADLNFGLLFLMYRLKTGLSVDLMELVFQTQVEQYMNYALDPLLKLVKNHKTLQAMEYQVERNHLFIGVPGVLGAVDFLHTDCANLLLARDLDNQLLDLQLFPVDWDKAKCFDRSNFAAGLRTSNVYNIPECPQKKCTIVMKCTKCRGFYSAVYLAVKPLKPEGPTRDPFLYVIPGEDEITEGNAKSLNKRLRSSRESDVLEINRVAEKYHILRRPFSLLPLHCVDEDMDEEWDDDEDVPEVKKTVFTEDDTEALAEANRYMKAVEVVAQRYLKPREEPTKEAHGHLVADLLEDPLVRCFAELINPDALREILFPRATVATADEVRELRCEEIQDFFEHMLKCATFPDNANVTGEEEESMSLDNATQRPVLPSTM